MSAATRQQQATIAKALDTRGSELRYQALQLDNALRQMSLESMLSWFGGDIEAGQSWAGFKTAVASIKRWHELRNQE